MARGTDVTGETRSLYRVNVGSPNHALSKWLQSAAAYTLVERYTAEVFSIYEAHLPIRRTRLGRQPSPGNLKRSAYYRVDRAGWGAEKDRWMGHVGNFAPYARVIEYGSRTRGIAGRHTLRSAGLAVFGHGSAEGGAFSNIKKSDAKILSRIDRNSVTRHRKERANAAKSKTKARHEVDKARRKHNAVLTAELRKRNKEFHKARHQLTVAERGAARLLAKRKQNDPNETKEARRARLGIVSPEDIAKDEKRLNRKTRSDKGKARGKYQPRDPDRKNKTARLPEKKRGKEGNRAAKRFNELIEIREKRLQSYSEGPRLRYQQLLEKEESGAPLTSREEKFMEHYLDNLHDD